LGFIRQVGLEEPFSRIEIMARQHIRDFFRPAAVLTNDISPTGLNQKRSKRFTDAATGARDQY
jgi:hypothetical protein